MNPDDFNPSEIEQMEVEFETCPKCKGAGIIFTGIHYLNCPICFGTGDIPIVREVRH